MKKLSVAIGLVLLASSAQAQANRSAAEARRVVDEVRAKYSTLETYSHTSTSPQVKGQPAPGVAKFWFRQPNRFAATYQSPDRELLSISNGRTFYSYSSSFNKTKYYAMPMPPVGLGRMGLMQYNAAGSFFTPFVAGVDPLSAPWGEAPRNLSFGAPTTINGIAVDAIVVQLARSDNAKTTYFIGQKDRLLYQITHAGGTGKHAYTYTETYKDIRLNPKIPIDRFAFVPPHNTQQEDKDTAYRRALRLSESIKVGAAPPALEGMDLQHRPVHLKDFKGKVVLLDFWATWCGPCIEELPHIKAAYEKFHDQDFEIIGISFDQDREALEKYIREKNLPWTQIFDGKMFQSTANENYKVNGIPFTLLIGRDGKIAAFNPRKLLLEPAIEKALSAPSPE